MNVQAPAAAVLLLAAGCSLISGCTQTPAFPNVLTTSSDAGADSVATTLKGSIHGGQQPIVGARIYLLAAGTTGYGSPSTSLLTSASYPGYTATQDTLHRWYVLTDATGSFQIMDSCTPGQQVYVASVGGYPGSNNNDAANEIALLGQCPAAGNFDGVLTGVYISEISTIAAAYAAAAYASDTFHIGAPSATTLEQTGIANAFANAADLFNIQNLNDVALTTTPSGNGTVPQAKIHTLANILASCVNSTGPSSPGCSLLFSSIHSAVPSVAAPTDTVMAAIDLARNPWISASSMISLQTSNSPFSPQLASTPSDLSLSISYQGAALAPNPYLAIDGGGNVWTYAPGGTAVSKLSPQGALLSGTGGFAIQGGFTGGRGLALDPGNNVWVLGQATGSLTPVASFAELNNAGDYEKVVTENGVSLVTYPPTASTNLVLDGAGNFFYSGALTTILGASNTCCTVQYNPNSGNLTALDAGNASPGKNFVAVNTSTVWATGGNSTVSEESSGSKVAVSGGGLNAAKGVALDSAGNAWVANSAGNSLSKFSSAGKAISGTNGYTGGLAAPTAVAVDGSGSIWATNSQGTTLLSQFTNAGTAIGAGYSNAGVSNAGAMAIDASGNIWVASSSTDTVTEFLGVASPVVTPTSVAISNGSLGALP